MDIDVDRDGRYDEVRAWASGDERNERLAGWCNMGTRPEGSWAIVENGTVIWFINDDLAAKGDEYLRGTVVEDNGDKVFVEEWDGTTHNLSKKDLLAYRKE
jgi:hypothetical protein